MRLALPPWRSAIGGDWLGQPALGIIAAQQPQQPALGGGDDHRLQVVGAHRLEQVGELAVWSDGRGSRLHDSLGSRIRVAFQDSLAEPPEQRAILGEDQGEPVGGAGDPLANGADALVQPGRGHILAEQVLGAGDVGLFPFGGKSVGKPVGLAEHVVVDPGEPEGLEPARGSWAQVSQPIPAVDDHRAGAVQR